MIICLSLITILALSGCNRSNDQQSEKKNTGNSGRRSSFNPHISDNYQNIAAFKYHSEWGVHNVHDPSVIMVGHEFYLYSTDVAYGWRNLKRVGIQIRKSKDLIHWKFIGWAFKGIPSKAKQYVTQHNDGKKPHNIWAPYIMKVGKKFRLYYVVSVFGSNASYIGLATSDSPTGPWTQKGSVVETTHKDLMNAIDPSVIVDHNNGKYWMSYGSYFGGIYMIQLNPKTGLALHPGDKGHRIAFRLKKGNSIEGSDLLYNPKLKKYYLFVSYGWLGNSYNVRVGRASQPQGPYYDFKGRDMAKKGNDLPRITAEYRFDHKTGWVGFGGNCTLRIGSKYFYLSQARPTFNRHMMDLHVHKIIWTKNGWPVISPERYDDVPQHSLTADSLIGKWRYIVLNHTKKINESKNIQLLPNGNLEKGKIRSSWSYSNGKLKLKWNGGQNTVSVIPLDAWDWENNRLTIVFTGLNDSGISVWGKKLK